MPVQTRTGHQFQASVPLALPLNLHRTASRPFTIVAQREVPLKPTGGVALQTKTIVPQWMFTKGETRLFFCIPLSFVSALFWWNVVGVVAHTALAIITIAVAGWDNIFNGLPELPMYVTKLNSTLSEVASGESGSGQGQFQIVFDRKEVDPLPLGALTLSFFLLSFAFHSISVITSIPDKFEWENRAFCFLPAGVWGSYYYHIAHCTNPLRWVEYSFSASTMILTIAIASFVRDVYLVFALWSLTFCTMTYGYFTEVINKHEETNDPDGRPQRWKLNRDSSNLVVPSMLVPLQRLVPHIIGYVPYAVNLVKVPTPHSTQYRPTLPTHCHGFILGGQTVWIILLHSFLFNAYSGSQGPPEWVKYVRVCADPTHQPINPSTH